MKEANKGLNIEELDCLIGTKFIIKQDLPDEIVPNGETFKKGMKFVLRTIEKNTSFPYRFSRIEKEKIEIFTLEKTEIFSFTLKEINKYFKNLVKPKINIIWD